jgi:hypothetical protein
VGVRPELAAAAAAFALAVPAAAGPVDDAARYLESRQSANGGFAEPGSAPTPGLTAWAVLGLRAAGRPAARLEAARAYLERVEGELEAATDLELALVARAALGEHPIGLVGRVRALVRPSGAIGPTVNSTIWGVLALRAAGERPAPTVIAYLLRQQSAAGGWAWSVGSAPDSNDTAAALQALRAAGVRGAPIRRALAFLRRFRNADGGFELNRGRGSDVQSTAWAIQAFAAAGKVPPAGALRYLASMRRPDGSYRYSARYAVTPVWVTAQTVPALAGRPLPLR